MFSSTGPGRHGWHDNLTCFDLGQQIIISAFCVEYLIRVLFGSSCAVPLLLAFVFRTREFFMSLLFLEVSFLATSWRFLEISLTAGLVFSFRLPLATGGWPAVRVSKSSARFGSPWFLFYRLAFSVAGAFYYSCTMPMALVVWC